MISGVYGVLHRDSGRWYVGRAANVGARWRQHQHHAEAGSKLSFHEAIREHGLAAFTWITLQPCSAVEAITLEVEWIARLRAFSEGFNCTEGGDMAPGRYESVRAKMSAILCQRTDRPFLGRKHSTKSIELMRAAARRRGPEWREKLSAIASGRKLSEEHRAHLRSIRVGSNRGAANPFYGKKHTVETRQRIVLANTGQRRVSKEKEDGIVTFRLKGMTLKQIATEIRVSKGTASRVLTERYGRSWVNEDLAKVKA